MHPLTTASDVHPAPRFGAVVDLPDQELEGRLKRLSAIERKALALLLEHLGEFDRRRLYAERGQPSLFQYCVGVLGYSEQAAYKRIQAARAAREHPLLLEHLVRGELHLAAIVVLAPHVRTENLTQLIAAARGKSKHDLELLVAGLAPRPDCQDTLKALPLLSKTPTDDTSHTPEERTPPRGNPTSAPRERLEPLSPQRFLFRFSASAALRAKYAKAAELLSRRQSGRAMERIFEAAIDCLLDRLDPERRHARREAKKKRTAVASLERARTVPQALRDEVWRRDGGRCAFVLPGGDRCPATAWLEIDHIRPYALGGRSDDMGNLRLLCRAHNQLMARRVFGNYPRG